MKALNLYANVEAGQLSGAVQSLVQSSAKRLPRDISQEFLAMTFSRDNLLDAVREAQEQHNLVGLRDDLDRRAEVLTRRIVELLSMTKTQKQFAFQEIERAVASNPARDALEDKEIIIYAELTESVCNRVRNRSQYIELLEL